MSDPITTGIGLGVGTSLLTGGNPLVGGALGGLGGGVFGGFKPGGFASGMFNSTPAAGIVGTTGEMGSRLLQSVNPVTGALTNASIVMAFFCVVSMMLIFICFLYERVYVTKLQ
jgi:hypothetical protein